MRLPRGFVVTWNIRKAVCCVHCDNRVLEVTYLNGSLIVVHTVNTKNGFATRTPMHVANAQKARHSSQWWDMYAADTLRNMIANDNVGRRHQINNRSQFTVSTNAMYRNHRGTRGILTSWLQTILQIGFDALTAARDVPDCSSCRVPGACNVVLMPCYCAKSNSASTKDL